MSYYKVKSVDLRDKDKIKVTVASSNVTPVDYERVDYTGTVDDLFKDMMSGNLKLNDGNRQQVQEAYLQANIYLNHKKVHRADIWDANYIHPEYDKALQIFKQVLDGKRNKRKYYIEIDGYKFYGWTKYGYQYKLGGAPVEKEFVDLLRAQLNYGDKVTYEEV